MNGKDLEGEHIEIVFAKPPDQKRKERKAQRQAAKTQMWVLQIYIRGVQLCSCRAAFLQISAPTHLFSSHTEDLFQVCLELNSAALQDPPDLHEYKPLCITEVTDLGAARNFMRI